jgi:hypothetical protein
MFNPLSSMMRIAFHKPIIQSDHTIFIFYFYFCKKSKRCQVVKGFPLSHHSMYIVHYCETNHFWRFDIVGSLTSVAGRRHLFLKAHDDSRQS